MAFRETRHTSPSGRRSAATATLTTLVMGALSDKVGKRKAFICIGYILWGLSTIAFGFISTDAVAASFPSADAVLVAAVIIIILDCVMTFFGSTANDGAFNAWVTDITESDDRGKVDGTLALLPLFALLIIFGGFDGFTKSGNWPMFFFLLGGLVSLGGIAGIFLIRDPKMERSPSNYWKNVANGFLPATVRRHPSFYLSLLTLAVFCTATQIYMPYFIIYIQQYLGIDAYAVLLGIVIFTASVAAGLATRKADAKNRNKFFFPALGVMAVGLVLLYAFKNAVWVGIAGFIMMAGNLVFTGVLNAKIRDHTPAGQAGQFQGIRMIFYVRSEVVGRSSVPR